MEGAGRLFYSVIILFIGCLLINGVFAFQTKFIGTSFGETFRYQLYALPIVFLANILLGLGYKMGYKYIGNNTLVVSGSKLLDIISLLLVSFIFFTEIPSWKTLVGLCLVIAGIIVTKV